MESNSPNRQDHLCQPRFPSAVSQPPYGYTPIYIPHTPAVNHGQGFAPHMEHRVPTTRLVSADLQRLQPSASTYSATVVLPNKAQCAFCSSPFDGRESAQHILESYMHGYSDAPIIALYRPLSSVRISLCAVYTHHGKGTCCIQKRFSRILTSCFPPFGL